MRLRQEWLNRPRDVKLCFLASLRPSLALWWVGFVVYMLSFGFLNPEDEADRLS